MVNYTQIILIYVTFYLTENMWSDLFPISSWYENSNILFSWWNAHTDPNIFFLFLIIKIFIIITEIVSCEKSINIVLQWQPSLQCYYIYINLLIISLGLVCLDVCFTNYSWLFLSVQDWYVNYINILDNLKCLHHASF